MDLKKGWHTLSYEEESHSKKFVIKKILDNIGFGFGSQQFVNVLLFLSGASLFAVGIVNGLKAILSIIVSIFLQEYNRVKKISKYIIGFSGIFFGFSFLLMAFAKLLNSPLIFSIAMLLSGISIVIYGDFSHKFFMFGKRGILEKIAKYGLIVTAISLFLAAFILDRYKDGTLFILNIFGKSLLISLPGYIITFEIAAISFILSGYFLASIKEPESSIEGKYNFNMFFSDLKLKSKKILKNKFLMILILFNIITGLIQVIGNSYYGIFIYQNYKNAYFGGFLNIAIVFVIGVFSSLIGYTITKINAKSYGPIFMLIIGSLFLSMMPLSYSIGKNLTWLTGGTILGIIGASALGVSSNMLTIGILNEDDRRYYYILNSLFSLIPYLILIPLLSYLTQAMGLNILFSFLGWLLILFTILSFILMKIL